MRVVVDLQRVRFPVALAESRLARFLRELLAENVADTDFIVSVSVENAVELRKALAGVLPSACIRVRPEVNVSDDASSPRADAEINKAFLAQLSPDVLLVPASNIELADSITDYPAVPIVVIHDTADGEGNIPAACEAIVFLDATPRSIPAPAVRLDGNSPASVLRWLRSLAPPDAPVPSSPVAKPKLAYFSPMPPQKSGIGDYSAELIPELARFYDIDIIVEQQHVAPSPATAACGVRSVEWFKANADAYDRVLYHVGNAEFHLYMLDCLEEFPGVVVMHDFFLSGAYAYEEFETGTPYAWTRQLYESHGYKALLERFHSVEVDKLALKYPVNFDVIRHATGIIVHSEFSRKLAASWYGDSIAEDWVCIPHLRVAKTRADRSGARERLGVGADEFVVCCFGMLGIAKQNQRLLDAWLKSELGADTRCRLVFVGHNGTDAYARTLEDTIRKAGVADRVTITGWASHDTFHDYLAAADLAVQLRTHSRGETSGTVLDCMNYQLPVIVNACGPMGDLPRDGVWMLPESFEDAELVDAMEMLWRSPERRRTLGERAREIILEQHDPQACARSYTVAIERFHERNERAGRGPLIERLAKLPLPREPERLADVARAVAESLPLPRPARTLFFDVSVTSRTDLRTGIERVSRALLNEFVHAPPGGFRVEPMYLSNEGGRWHYRYARRFTLRMFGCPDNFLFDEPIEPQAGDVFFCADLAADMVAQAEADGVYEQLQIAGVNVSFMVHDLLPMTMPEVFPPGAGTGFEQWLRIVARRADNIVCVTRTVAEKLRSWLHEQDVNRNDRLRLCWSHHGADIAASAPSGGVKHDRHGLLDALENAPGFLAVGTIEPRKGHAQLLDAFEHLWARGSDAVLVIVGKEGWKDLPDEQRRDIPAVVKRLRKHPQRNRQLFWVEDASDAMLEALYAKSACLVAASHDEGFGLPLIEASRHHLPILARDIPVFREVAGDRACWFTARDGEELAEAIDTWRRGGGESLAEVRNLSWGQSAENLAALLCEPGNPPRHSGEHRGAGVLNLRDASRKALYVDVSVIAREDFHTGIQRTTRALFKEIATNPPEGYDVYPVMLFEHRDEWRYEMAAEWFERYCAPVRSSFPLVAGEVEPREGDVLLCLDLAGSLAAEAGEAGLYERFRERGAAVWFVVYDLLPVTHAKYFPEADAAWYVRWLRVAGKADGVACISRAVADQFTRWHAEHLGGQMPQVCAFHLGADIAASAPSGGVPAGADEQIRAFGSRPTFLVVGTVEPRKGYGQVLEAFSQLWAAGADVNLVIVGKRGWQAEDLVARLEHHNERGVRLFWLEGISDEYLETVYGAATCLVAASEDEGFGLPLVEAARHGLPLLVRDIPVFKEVAGERAFYFNGRAPEDLAAAVREWLALDAGGQAPQSQGLRWHSWRESAKELIEVVLGSRERVLKQTDGS